MIANVESTFKHITNQLRDYVKQHALSCAVVVFDARRSSVSILATQLCISARLNTKCFISTDCINKCMPLMKQFSRTNIILHDNDEELFHESIAYADTYNGILIGSLSRNDRFNRAYGKWKEGRADLFPIYELYLSEVNQLLRFNELSAYCHEMTEDDGMVEYLDSQHPDIILADEMPNKNKMWFRYTMQQKEAIAKLHAREKKTRLKQIDPSRYLVLRNLPWFK